MINQTSQRKKQEIKTNIKIARDNKVTDTQQTRKVLDSTIITVLRRKLKEKGKVTIFPILELLGVLVFICVLLLLSIISLAFLDFFATGSIFFLVVKSCSF